MGLAASQDAAGQIDMQRLDHLKESMASNMRQIIAARRRTLQGRETALAKEHPRVQLTPLRNRMGAARERSVVAMRQWVKIQRQTLGAAGRRLNALSPLGVLDRGYAIVLGPKGQAVREPAAVEVGDRLDVRVAGGRIAAKVLGEGSD